MHHARYNHVLFCLHFNFQLSIFNFQFVLRFANRLKYQLHLIAGEVARSTRVARALQGIEQAIGGVQVLVEQPQGRGTRGTGAVELRQLGFAVGAEGLVFHRVKS